MIVAILLIAGAAAFVYVGGLGGEGGRRPSVFFLRGWTSPRLAIDACVPGAFRLSCTID